MTLLNVCYVLGAKVCQVCETNFRDFFSFPGTENAYLRAWFKSQKVEFYPISLGMAFCFYSGWDIQGT
jgi:hypothetical protein